MLTIKVDGLAEVQRALRAAGANAEQLREPNLTAARLVSDESKREAPRRSGDLAAAHSADATQRFGVVIADIDYAGVIFGGWSTRGLGRRAETVEVAKGLSATKASRAAFRARAAEAGISARAADKAFRQAKARKVRGGGMVGAVRGGPIRPNPWIYRAGDRREDDVLKAYERHIDGIARVFNGGAVG